jgi:NTE family protein
VALHALTLLSQQQLIGEVARYADPAKLKVMPPLCPLKVSAADFSHADELITRAYKATGSWLDSGGPDLPAPQRFLSMHGHNRASSPASTRSGQTPIQLQPDR